MASLSIIYFTSFYVEIIISNCYMYINYGQFINCLNIKIKKGITIYLLNLIGIKCRMNKDIKNGKCSRRKLGIIS